VNADMPIDNYSTNFTDPCIFSRGSLKLTFDLLRNKNPKLALLVRNIIGGSPLPKSVANLDNENTDFFKVDLDSFQVREIVEILMEYGHQQADNSIGMGLEVVAKTLVDDWVLLAKKMISELSDKPDSDTSKM
jgi:hypothetical protein